MHGKRKDGAFDILEAITKKKILKKEKQKSNEDERVRVHPETAPKLEKEIGLVKNSTPNSDISRNSSEGSSDVNPEKKKNKHNSEFYLLKKSPKINLKIQKKDAKHKEHINKLNDCFKTKHRDKCNHTKTTAKLKNKQKNKRSPSTETKPGETSGAGDNNTNKVEKIAPDEPGCSKKVTEDVKIKCESKREKHHEKKKEKKDKHQNKHKSHKKKDSFKMSLMVKIKGKSSKKRNSLDHKIHKKKAKESKEHTKKSKEKISDDNDKYRTNKMEIDIHTERIKQEPEITPSKKKQKKRKNSGGHQLYESPKKKKKQENLLEDKRIAKHACVLWSSENRRYYQQLDPNAKPEEVEATMLKAWEKLSNKEKLRYFQRAHGALNDLNKHSNKKSNKALEKPRRPVRPDTEAAMKKFCELTDAEQKQKLWDRMLQLQRNMTRQSYRMFVTDFLRSFRSTVNSMRLKHDVKSSRWKATMEGTFRRLLYGKIVQEIPVADANWEHRYYIFQKEIKSNFDRVVNRLITGKRVCFDPRVRSSSLDVLLQDLEEASFYTEFNMEALVNELLQEIDDPFAAGSVEDLITTAPLDCYRLIPISETTKPLWQDDYFEFKIGGEKVPVPKPKNGKTDCDLLRNSSLGGLCVFSGEEVDEFFNSSKEPPQDIWDSTDIINPVQHFTENMYNSWYRMSHGLQACCPLDAPSCILSDALALDKIRKAEMRHNFERSMRTYNQYNKHVQYPLSSRPGDPIRGAGDLRANGGHLKSSSNCVTTSATTASRPALPEIIPIRIPHEKQEAKPVPKVTKIVIPTSSSTPQAGANAGSVKKSGGTTLTFHTVRLTTPSRPMNSTPGLSILNPIQPTTSGEAKVQRPTTPHITVMVHKPAPATVTAVIPDYKQI